MAKLYVYNIINGKWTFAKVNPYWKEEVRRLLIEEGREDLITE